MCKTRVYYFSLALRCNLGCDLDPKLQGQVRVMIFNGIHIFEPINEKGGKSAVRYKSEISLDMNIKIISNI